VKTRHGIHTGKDIIVCGPALHTTTVWDGILQLDRVRAGHLPFVRKWRGRYLVGGLFWREIPQNMTKNVTLLYLYPDTALNALTRAIRPLLVSGLSARQRISMYAGRLRLE